MRPSHVAVKFKLVMHKLHRRKHAIARLKCEFCPRYFRNTTGLAIHRNSIHLRPAQSIVTPADDNDEMDSEDGRPDHHPPADFVAGSEDPANEDSNPGVAAASRIEFHPTLDGKVVHAP